MEDYNWVCGNFARNIKAKNMKDACKKAIIAQIPVNTDNKEQVILWFSAMKVAKGKLPV